MEIIKCTQEEMESFLNITGFMFHAKQTWGIDPIQSAIQAIRK